MAFKTTSITPDIGYNQSKRKAAAYKNILNNAVASMAGGTTSPTILDTLLTLREFNADMAVYKAIAGIGAYAQAQEDDVNYDVVAEFNAMTDAIDAAIAQITSTFPTDGTYILAHTMSAAGVVSGRSFTAGQVASIITSLNAIIASID